ncbi:MAG: hypothetical protein LBI14_10515 [Treponema sp.]|jgi:hypothetical protein|nr:hypothetical protein [Treponema sp.]
MGAAQTNTAISEGKAYAKIITAFKKRKKGSTAADLVAATGLPLNTVKDLVPKAADEYRGRLEVTESGEILYSFPQGFTSRYRGFGPSARKAFDSILKGSAAIGKFLFKIWIMIMLVGYFLLFIAIALASLFLTIAASSSRSSSSRGGSMRFSMSIFNLIMRLWLYSEFTKPMNPSSRSFRKSKSSRPLHQSIFSFVFGDGDPNANQKEEEKKAFVSYLQENRGVISLPELMALNGLTSLEAEAEIIALCAEFGGMPEATPDATVVYRFDEILLQSEKKQERKDLFPLRFKNLLKFSTNPQKLNWWFSIINGVNLLFGTYFLYNAFSIGRLITNTSSMIYQIVYKFLSSYTDPLPIITVALGVIPLAFSLLFWLIPLLRHFFIKGKNEKIKFENFRKFSFSKIWMMPLSIKKADLKPGYKEADPKNLPESQDKALKEMGTYTIPEVALDDHKNEVYSFAELAREKDALTQYRSSINPEASSLGKTIFDSES